MCDKIDQDTFSSLLKEWVDDTMFCSSSHFIMSHASLNQWGKRNGYVKIE